MKDNGLEPTKKPELVIEITAFIDGKPYSAKIGFSNEYTYKSIQEAMKGSVTQAVIRALCDHAGLKKEELVHGVKNIT